MRYTHLAAPNPKRSDAVRCDINKTACDAFATCDLTFLKKKHARIEKKQHNKEVTGYTLWEGLDGGGGRYNGANFRFTFVSIKLRKQQLLLF